MAPRNAWFSDEAERLLEELKGEAKPGTGSLLQVANFARGCSRERSHAESFLLGPGLQAMHAALNMARFQLAATPTRRHEEIELETFQLLDSLSLVVRNCRAKAALRSVADQKGMILSIVGVVEALPAGRKLVPSFAAALDVLGTVCAGGDHCARRILRSSALMRLQRVIDESRESARSTLPLRDIERGLARLTAATGAEPRQTDLAPVRILSIDGGGTRAVLAIEVLRELEALTGRPTRENFDLIAGTSSGGVLALALGLHGATLDHCEAIVQDMSANLFTPKTRGAIVLRPGKALLNRGVYDAQVYESILQKHLGSRMLIDSRAVTRDECEPPRVFTVSTLVSRSPAVPILHSNYRLPLADADGGEKRFEHSCHHRLWEAARASTSAPVYFRPFVSGDEIFCDGAILVNNPALFALRESRQIWPGRQLQTLVSVGTGRSVSSASVHIGGGDGIIALGRTVLESATETETTHRALDELVPAGRYHRFSPILLDRQMTIDEFRSDKLHELKNIAQSYIFEEQSRFRAAAASLTPTARL